MGPVWLFKPPPPPRKLGDQIPTKELGPKTLYSFNNL